MAKTRLSSFQEMQKKLALLYEFGVVLPEGVRALTKAWPAAMATAADQLPGMLIDSLREQWTRVQTTEAEITSIERRLASALRENQSCQQIAAIPGGGRGHRQCEHFQVGS